MEYNYTDAFKTARESQSKYDYFFLGATLGVLSLSIQTFKPDEFLRLPALAILSWILWLASFLAGLLRQERINMFLRTEAGFIRFKPRQDILLKAKSGEQTIYKSPDSLWTSEEIDKELADVNDMVSMAESYKKKHNHSATIAYSIQKWSFVGGLVLYAAFRIVNLFWGQQP